ncbi:LAME_0D00518g1_1 [Lachancea meyersii CBS 8951]|uniref:Serine/threonine-protein phosphatase 2A activator n=1 Tax=Lachancea meyersii CBS 8951 TaxID=1266667 RepID=A0A1G4J5W7_9SACH|nr:LAME_0D00518g1_1 [Lachancea meyersii CBS 8951]
MEARPISIDVRSTTFEEPTKRIFDSRGTQVFQKSVAMYRLKMYLHRYISIVGGQQIPENSQNPKVIDFVKILDEFASLVDQTPALPGPKRYGNLACRTWHDKIENVVEIVLESFMPSEYNKSIVELRYYLANAFGSRERLDYGTGHELSFFALVSALDMLGIWGSDLKGTDLLFLLNRYYGLIQKLVVTYTLEPAGSHGVWGLDDHFHLVYIFGASQLVGMRSPPATPKEMQKKYIVQENSSQNLYCQGLSFVFQVKSGQLSENSPMLYDIAQTVPTWSKVQRGLLKMYFAEVLNKFPVVQHFWFGKGLYPWVSTENGEILPFFEASLPSSHVQTPFSNTTTRHPMNPPDFRGVSRFISQDRFRRS